MLAKNKQHKPISLQGLLLLYWACVLSQARHTASAAEPLHYAMSHQADAFKAGCNTSAVFCQPQTTLLLLPCSPKDTASVLKLPLAACQSSAVLHT
jgi:hypothetical protein